MQVIGLDKLGFIRVVFEGNDFESLVPQDPSNRHRQLIAEWEALGNTIPPYVPPEAIPAEKEVYLYAAAYNLSVVDGEIQSVTAVDSSIFGITWIAPGYYECYLVDTFNDLDYYPKVYDHEFNMQVIEKNPDYFVITSMDGNGDLADPVNFNIEINTIR